MSATETGRRTASPAYRLVVSYHGARYAGWQLQRGEPTIQGELERAVEALFGRPIRLSSSGRTDAGVHALGQVVSFAAERRWTDDAVRGALNARLPEDIRVLSAEHRPLGFHALRDAAGKRYRYLIQDGRQTDVFRRGQAWRIHQALNVEAMARASRHLLGRHDFSSFEAAGSPRVSSVRTIRDIELRRVDPPPQGLVRFEVEADGFLYNMVRIIVGTLVEIGRGKQAESWVGQLLEARHRPAAGMTAPPEGLYLLRVYERACERESDGGGEASP